MRFFLSTLLAIGATSISSESSSAVYRVGVAKIDITPDYPIRLSGFGFRRTESEGITQRIWAKALAIDDGEPAVLITVDNLGVPAYLVQDLAKRLEKHGVRPERLAVTASHTHTAPMLNAVAPTLFGMPIPGEQQERINRYTGELTDNLEKVSLAALADRKPARLSWGLGSVSFAKNRRTKGGPVDHDLPVLAVRDQQGKLRAVYVNYACHCVTLSNNKISGDWAGYAQELIEQEFPGTVALVSIGCGGDQNPDSRAKGETLDFVSRQGGEIAREVKRLLGGFLAPLEGRLKAAVGHFDLPLDTLPSREQWHELAAKEGAIGYHARVNLARLDAGKKIQDHIPYSVQSWAFGNSLAMVFLPGEVTVDYSLRLKRELDRQRLWINAYANDDPCYIPSERVLKEGGYEGGGAMIYYDVPTHLRAGLEQKIIAAVHEQIGKPFAPPFDTKKIGGSLPLSPQQSLAAIRTKKDLVVELVAAEPLVADPVAIDWGPDGKLWVCEMHDYPEGVKGDYQPAGRIKILEDTDGDGIYDKATVFLDKIPFPTGVTVWRKGVLVCAAPDILYAEDTDGDGKADVVKKLYSGFGTTNYQARVNSLCYGLDNWVYGSCGLYGGIIKNFAGGTPLPLGDRDFRILPDKGAIEAASGITQQGRVRNDWADWFGCDNTTLCRHYPLDDHYLRRNPHLATPPTAVLVSDYPERNRLYPIQPKLQLLKRSGPFGKTTAACGLEIYRDDFLGKQYHGDAFVCEPVNLLVHRMKIEPKGSSFVGRRAPGEEKSEFLASTDTWFRPVQARTGPDGALWIVAMHRYVIEHPRWIPPEDLAKMDVRAGSTMGRIFRVRPRTRGEGRGARGERIGRLDKLDTAGLVAALDSPNGWQRDLAQQMLLWRNDVGAANLLENLAQSSPSAETRLQTLCTLDGLGKLEPHVVRAALSDRHPGVRRQAVRLSEKWLNMDALLGPALTKLVNDKNAQVRLQLAYSLGEWKDKRAGQALTVLLVQHADDPYLTTAVLSSVDRDNVGTVLTGVFAFQKSAAVARVLEMAVALDERTAVPKILLELSRPRQGGFNSSQMIVFAGVMDVLERSGKSLSDVVMSEAGGNIGQMMTHARVIAAREQAPLPERLAAVRLLGRKSGSPTGDVQILGGLLGPQNPPALQGAALAMLGRIPDDKAADILLADWKTYAPGVKSTALDLLLERPSWQKKLLQAIDSKVVSAANIDAAHRQRLLNNRDKEMQALAVRVFAGAVNRDRQKVINDYADALKLPGDAVRGKAVFVRRCYACHALEGYGHDVGPDLTSLANKTSLYLLTEILDPSRNIDSRYVEYMALTKSGRIFTGLLASESASSITLRGQEGKQQVLLRSELESFSSTGKSLMPDGLEKDLTKQDMADVIKYLTHKESKSSRLEPWGGSKVPAPVTATLESVERFGLTAIRGSGRD